MKNSSWNDSFQNVYEWNDHRHLAYVKGMTVSKMFIDNTNVEKMSINEMCVHEVIVDNISVDKTTVDKSYKWNDCR